MLKNKKEQMNNFKNLYNYLENLKLTFNKNQRELNQLMFEQELIREKMNNLKKTLDVLS
jgi:endonuclease III